MKKILFAMMMMMVAGIAISAPVSSMLATRSAINSAPAEKWENPYVTDGLVAMWDGEWNAGGGVHDETAIEWKDLCGGENLIIGGGTPIINEQSIDCSRQSKGICYWKYPNNGYIQFISSTNYIIEVVCKVNINVNHIVFRNGSGRFWQGLKARIILGARRKITPSLQALSTTTSYHLDFVNRATYRNGELYTRTGEDSNTFYSSMFIIGSNNSDYAGAEVFSFRIYNRALTQDEISHNYAIDKERFGLP